ncbi:hypothetical protein MKW98_022298, partial [Papaver atlanticum]
MKDCPIPAPPKPQDGKQPQQQNVQKQNTYAKQPYHPRNNAHPFQPRRPNAQGKLNSIAEVKEEPENAVIE